MMMTAAAAASSSARIRRYIKRSEKAVTRTILRLRRFCVQYIYIRIRID